MPLRPATRDDIPIMATILAASFAPDRLFQIMFPHEPEHPEAFVQAFQENIWISWYDYRQVWMVSYEASDGDQQQPAGERDTLLSKGGESGTGKEILTGIAKWERAGKGWESVYGVWGWWDPRCVIKPLLSTLYGLRRRFFPNPASVRPTAENPNPLTYWNFVPALLPYCVQFLNASHRQTHWSLEILAVHPLHQGKGFGRALVEHGLERSKLDPEGDLPACVISAAGKEVFYQKCGFKELVGWTSRTVGEDGSDNPLRKNGASGGAVLWTR